MKLRKLTNLYLSEEECLDFIRKKQWPEGLKCSKCKSRSLSTYKTKNSIRKYRCNKCSNIFSDISNTPLKKCKIKLNLLPQTILCLKLGLSYREIAKTTGVNIKTISKINLKKEKLLKFLFEIIP